MSRSFRVLIILAGAAIALTAAAPASAHLPRHHRPIAEMTLQQQRAYFTRVVAHTRYVGNWGKGRPARAHTRATRWAAAQLRRIDVRLQTPFVARPPHARDWQCIHQGEGAWSDSGDPYWGGLQMDRSFMLAYAPPRLLRRGLANVWTPLEQMWVAERALRAGRGFHPWPNTARACGLL